MCLHTVRPVAHDYYYYGPWVDRHRRRPPTTTTTTTTVFVRSTECASAERMQFEICIARRCTVYNVSKCCCCVPKRMLLRIHSVCAYSRRHSAAPAYRQRRGSVSETLPTNSRINLIPSGAKLLAAKPYSHILHMRFAFRLRRSACSYRSRLPAPFTELCELRK